MSEQVQRPTGRRRPAFNRTARMIHPGAHRPPTRSAFAGRPSKPPVAGWEWRYRAAVMASDLFAGLIALSTVGGLLHADLGIGGRYHWPVSIVCAEAVIWISLLAARAWRSNVLGQGAEEFRRLGRGLFSATMVLALITLAVGQLGGRPWVFLAMPAVAMLAMPQRYILRRYLHRARQSGRFLLPVLAAGGVGPLSDLIDRTRRAPHIGWRVDAVCTVPGTAAEDGMVDGVPVIGSLSDLAEHVRRGGYRILAIAADPYWSPRRLQQLAWDLEGSEAEMVVAPVLMEVAGPRLHVTGVLGMPLLRVSAPAFTGARRVAKEIFDRVAAALLGALLLPVLLLIALLIRLTSRGPALYRQHRVGKDGRTFTMIKFRTMVVDAHARRHELTDGNQGSGPMFKLRRDPRVTRVGAWLRRYSVDELPQLLNVLGGSMSLVGPRPPLPEETETYGPDVRRRLLVKPGLTGLWQVSGRSDLPWDEAVRLDLRYVEDWSLALDAVILWKTVRAVFRARGAY
jgi:exopolysaccharide biosynthesis polyprenyl glycosylphosphotransferase